MTNAARSIVAWGIYALLASGALLFQPDLTLQFLGFSTTSEHWILIVALLLMGLGFYYVVLGAIGVREFFIASIFGRTVFFIATVILIAIGKVPVAMILFGAIDLISAVWTAVALHIDRKSVNSPPPEISR